MNFYIVPQMLYQDQQKLKKKKHSKRREKSRLGSTSEHGQSRSSKSTASSRSIHSINEDAAGNESEILLSKKGGIRGSISSKNADFASEGWQLSLGVQENAVPTSSSAMSIDSRQNPKRDSRLGLVFSTHSAVNSTHTTGKDIGAPNRKMSFSQVPTASSSSESPSTFGSPRDHHRSVNLKSVTPKFQIPKFELIMDLAILNDDTTAKLHFYNQLILETRFESYLSLVSEHQLSDLINFSVVRTETLIKLIKRHGLNHLERLAEKTIRKVDDIRYYESLMFYELMQCRNFIGQLLLAESTQNSKKETMLFNETLLQLNFVNYIWYVLSLPNISLNDQTCLDEVVSKHYHFKSIFLEVRGILSDLHMDSYSEDISSSVTGTNLFMQCVAKVVSEFVILENYFIQSVSKFGGNSPIDSRVTKHLFGLYDLNMKLGNHESLKVLHYNMLMSDRFSWNLAIRVPFVRVYEMNINNEYKDSMNDLQAYHKQSGTQKITLSDKDKILFDQYFKMLDLSNYEHYHNMTGKELVDLQKAVMSHMHMSSMLDDSSSVHYHKPPNLEYYSDSMLKIASNTFHVINCRDAYFQFTATNYRVILREFYRLLKSGGILELPLYIPGDSLIDTLMQKKNTLMRADFRAPKHIANFVFSICEELKLLFGVKNVRFSEVLLSPKNSISAFWVKYINFLTNDAYGDVNTFCAKHHLGDIAEIQNSEDKHFYCYIRAEKS